MTETNLYQSPQAIVEQTDDIEIDHLIETAKWQKCLIYTFLAYLLLVVGSMITIPIIALVISLLNIAAFIAMVIFNGLLCWRVYGRISRIIMVVLGIVPLFNLLVILAANSRANKKIRQAGYKVGFMGANIKQPEKQLTE